ncbi:hypothetical protein D187_010068 [Cystobacter fuscus DSM 2262]|uniref:Uncharacterized protein n=1 Tax=Cystobacter fuscus (strain ATCC 25194 / DSM 2262 / NBRC 100088 / M29) TaxID=1242864 RepID=S9QLM4_CYSF2|nr:hypothetical protein D187_010068 [Cystobacter fuscus DSM 2262]
MEASPVSVPQLGQGKEDFPDAGGSGVVPRTSHERRVSRKMEDP